MDDVQELIASMFKKEETDHATAAKARDWMERKKEQYRKSWAKRSAKK